MEDNGNKSLLSNKSGALSETSEAAHEYHQEGNHGHHSRSRKHHHGEEDEFLNQNILTPSRPAYDFVTPSNLRNIFSKSYKMYKN